MKTKHVLIIAVAIVAAAICSAPALALNLHHGFRDHRAPAEAARILNTLPNVDGFSCHWKTKNHTIGCVGFFQGARAQLFMWSQGQNRIYYHLCEAGVCGHAFKTKHNFGKSY